MIEKGKYEITKRAKKCGLTLGYLSKRLGVNYDKLKNTMQGKVKDYGLLDEASEILDEFENELGISRKDKKEKIVKRKINK